MPSGDPVRRDGTFRGQGKEVAFMYLDLLRAEILKQREVYLALKAGRKESVCYKSYRHPEFGTQDENYENRLRLAYYLLYEKVEDEEVIFWLFQEELIDRETNSFQGIGAALEILTFLLAKYNTGHSYDAWFQRAKNANFDCACGYDPAIKMNDKFSDNDLLDCIYLCKDMGFRDVMELLVDLWKDSVAAWGDADRESLIRFYTFLGKEEENEMLYLEQLSSAKRTGKLRDTVQAYNRLIRHYLVLGQCAAAHGCLDEARELAEDTEIHGLHPLGDLLEEAFEVICQERAATEGGIAAEKSIAVACPGRDDTKTEELWEWAKAKFTNGTEWYGNLYIKRIAAAKAMKDPDSVKFDKEYGDWCKKVGIKKRG